MARALDWATRITSTSIMMVLPALLGYLVDQRLGTVILFAFLGLVLGMVFGIRQLLRIVAAQARESADAAGKLDRERSTRQRQTNGEGYQDADGTDSNGTS